MPRPVPLPRRQISLPDKTEDDKPLRCGSTPQSPTKSSKGYSVRSAPPPVSPKKYTVKKSPGGFDSMNGSLQIVKPELKSFTISPPDSLDKNSNFALQNTAVAGLQLPRLLVDEEPVDHYYEAVPPRLPPKPPKQQPDDKNETLDSNLLLDWWKDVTPWKFLCKDLKLRGKKETKIIKVKAEHLYKAIQVYILLLCEHGGFLKEHTSELLCIADNLDKVSKGTKIAGITGGATTALGGVAAAAGVILCPLTMGASLALTVIGVGVATAGGITGASAAIANKVNVTQDKKKIEKTFQEYEDLMVQIQDCLKFVNEGMEQLKEHDLSVLSEARMDSVRVARMIQLAATGGGSARAIEANSKASGLMHGFALGIDIHFTQGKDGKKVKKGHESKLAKKIRNLAEDISKALDELIQLKDLFCEHCSGV